jgi:catalase
VYHEHTRFLGVGCGERVGLTCVIGAHGVFESYGDYSNITAASFLSAAGKQTPVFVRFSTVAGSRGSADTARDVHGFATRFYTDEGNFGKTIFYVPKKSDVTSDLTNG